MVDTVVKLSIVINLVLSILISASRREFENLFLRFHWRHLENRYEELVNVGHSRVKRCKYKRFLRRVS